MGLFYSTKKESVTIVIHMNYIPIISQVFWIQIKTLCEKYPEKLLKSFTKKTFTKTESVQGFYVAFWARLNTISDLWQRERCIIFRWMVSSYSYMLYFRKIYFVYWHINISKYFKCFSYKHNHCGKEKISFSLKNYSNKDYHGHSVST